LENLATRIKQREYNPDTSNHKTNDLAKQGNRTTAGLHDGRTTYGDASAGRNLRDVWDIPTASFKGSHFATFPPKLVETCIKAGCPIGGVLLDPFCGSGTSGLVARRLGRNFVGIDLNWDYIKMAFQRILLNRK
jgi:site-specific DNA-methyltransferase (adenine-specific)